MKQERETLSRLPAVAMLAIALLMAAVIAYLSYTSGRSRDLAAEQSRISRRVQDATNDLLSLVTDAETGQRGFLITGREAYLVPYNKALSSEPGIFRELADALRDRPDEAQRAKNLQALAEAKLRELALTILVRRAQGFDAARKIVDNDVGKNLMDDIRAQCAVISDTAERRAADFTAMADSSGRRLRIVSTFGALVLFVFIVLLAVAVLRSLARREQLYHDAVNNAEHFRVTLHSIGDALIATDADRKITFINPVAVNLTGWSEQQAIGVDVTEVFSIVNETTRKPVENPLIRAIATNSVVGLANHTVLLARDGREIPIDDSGSPIRDHAGVIEGAILVFRDISRRREAERLLTASNDQLKEFVDAAAHDLRAPLRSVSLFSQLLEDRFRQLLTGEGQEYLRQIRDGAARMGRLLEDLLSYAQASHFAHHEGPRVPMDGALRTAIENLSADIESAHAVVTADGALPVVPVHDAHLLQLLQNLIGNAIKYRSSEPPRIHVSCHKTETGWRVEVKDNGIGIESEYRELIFKPFKRLHGEERPGSGIGLATCQKIIDGYGGRIWVESALGQGSTFFFTIPAPASHAIEASAAD